MSRQGDFFGEKRSFRREAQGAGRIGVVDVGSNSVRLVVFEGATRAPAYFFNEKVLCGLGADLSKTGRLAPEGRVRALSAIRRFVALAGLMRVSALDGVATAAVRDADDGPDFVEEVAAITGLELRIASGEDEARLSAQGVVLGWPGATGVAADLGGASMELVRLDSGRIGAGRTLQLGPLRLIDGDQSPAALDWSIDREIEQAGALIEAGAERLFLVGGAWRALARIHMVRTGYPLRVLHEYDLPAEEMQAAADFVADRTPEALRQWSDSSTSRLAVTPMGARVLARLIRALRPQRVAISAYGLREGVYFEHLPPRMRAEDPLLAAARTMEQRLARLPGFGEELTRWTMRLFPDVDARVARLIEAACLLNDVNWSSHPDYRSRACFDVVFRANFSGVSHAERAFVGLALLYRYKGGRDLAAQEPATGLIAPEMRRRAEQVGRTIRLGAMLAGSAPGVLEEAPVTLDDGRLALTLDEPRAELAGEAVIKRLKALGQAFDAEAELRISSPA